MAHSRLRSFAALAAKVLISAALIAFALRGVDSAKVVEHIARVDVAVIAFAVVVFTCVAFLHARRWENILARMEHRISYAGALRLILIGYFFNQTLPSSVGGDAYRAWGVYKHGIHAGNAIASVIVDRVFALLALGIMIGAGAWWLFDIVRDPMARAAVIAASAGAIGGFTFLLVLPRFATLLERWRATRLVLRVAEGSRAVLRSPAATLEVLLLTAAGFAVTSYVVYLLSQGMGVPLSMGYALLFIPLVTLVTILPISIAGWGLRESAMVVSLGLIGVPAAQAFSISVLFGLVIMASGVPGGLLWLAARKHKPAADSVEPAEDVR
jgi:uncharacterized protein (TIRG00374 family)